MTERALCAEWQARAERAEASADRLYHHLRFAWATGRNEPDAWYPALVAHEETVVLR